MTIRKRIEDLCVEQNTTIYKLEKALGFSRNTIRKWDVVVPSSKGMLLVANHLDVSVDYLLGRTEYKRSHRAELSKAGAIILQTTDRLSISEDTAKVLASIIETVITKIPNTK